VLNAKAWGTTPCAKKSQRQGVIEMKWSKKAVGAVEISSSKLEEFFRKPKCFVKHRLN
jgi:hypothetical protein